MSTKKYNTNLASEFYAMSVLYRLGADAHLTLGNKKAVDIVVVRGPGDAITLDVKAVAGKTDWIAGTPEPTPRRGHFVALLTFDGAFDQVDATPRAWIMPHDVFLGLVKSAAPPSAMRYVSRKEVTGLQQYEGAWRLLIDAPNGQPMPSNRPNRRTVSDGKKEK
jgi:hypothetical protein